MVDVAHIDLWAITAYALREPCSILNKRIGECRVVEEIVGTKDLNIEKSRSLLENISIESGKIGIVETLFVWVGVPLQAVFKSTTVAKADSAFTKGIDAPVVGVA